jgi:hypothetical protein
MDSGSPSWSYSEEQGRHCVSFRDWTFFSKIKKVTANVRTEDAGRRVDVIGNSDSKVNKVIDSDRAFTASCYLQVFVLHLLLAGSTHFSPSKSIITLRKSFISLS